MHHILNARADSHKDFCEDAYYYSERDGWVICGVFDGCGEGVNSHFASQLHSYALRFIITRYWDENVQLLNQSKVSIEGIINITATSLAQVVIRSADVLGVTTLENLSTAVIVLYNMRTQYLIVKFLGDGVIRINGAMHRVDSGPSNAPNYVGYLGTGRISELNELIRDKEKYPLMVFTNVSSFALCTDGIDAVRHAHRPLEEVQHYLLEDKFLHQSKAMLSRKLNILRNEGAMLNDDLTIIRYEAI